MTGLGYGNGAKMCCAVGERMLGDIFIAVQKLGDAHFAKNRFYLFPLID
jgi:hypothetical protein